MSTAMNTETTTWTIDPAHTNIEFAVKHMMFATVKGHFAGATGEIVVPKDDPSGATVTATIDASTIDTRTRDRDTHLRSADFLNVDEFSEITFRSTSVDGSFRKTGDTFRVTGDLTIRGTTLPVTLDVTYEGRGDDPWGRLRMSFSATTRLDRRKYGLEWNQALETGGILVGNDVQVRIDVQVVQQD